MSPIGVADAADGADGVTGLMLTYGRYPDCARSELPLAAEDNFDPEGAEEGLCPAQPTSECAGVLWPPDRLQILSYPTSLTSYPGARAAHRSCRGGMA